MQMEFEVTDESAAGLSGSALIVFGFKAHASSHAMLTENPQTKKALLDSLKTYSFESEVNQVLVLPAPPKSRFSFLVIAGLGEKANAEEESFRKAAAASVLTCKSRGYSKIALDLAHTECGVSFESRVRGICEGTWLAAYNAPDYRKIRQPRDQQKKIVHATLCVKTDLKTATRMAAESEIISNAVARVRNWVNWPSEYKKPVHLAEIWKTEAKRAGVSCTILTKKQLEKLGMGGILAINAGSMNPPVLLKLEYKPESFSKTVALVGKGITFDSGGLNLKSWEDMLTMKQDMAGAATVVGTMLAAAQLKLKVRILGFCPLTENLPGNLATKCGDIITTYNGKTIEMVHTDAEGRVVLSDALAYAEEHQPDCILDLATLTGAQRVALGRFFIGGMGNNPQLLDEVIKSGNATMERVWELPLISEWDDLVKSEVADVRNIGKSRGEAGTLIGGAFLKAFVEKTPWVHLDIASTAYFTESDATRPYLPTGASGVGVRLLMRFLQTQK